MVGSKSTLLPGVTLVDSHEIKKEVSVAECNVVTKKGLSRQHEPLQDLYWLEMGHSKAVTFCPGQKLCTLSVFLENLFEWNF